MKKFLAVLLLIIVVFLPVFGHCQESQVQISVSAQVQQQEAPPPLPPGGGGGGGVVSPPPPAKIIFQGRAYPLASLTLLKNGVTAATFQAFPSGLFEKELTGIPEGVYTFSIWAEDTKGRRSVTLGFSVGILAERTTTISGIFISPTISLEPTQVEKGKTVDIFGQAFPQSQVDVFISSPQKIVKETFTDKTGNWAYKLNTSPMEESQHEARVKALYGEGEQSPFSQTLAFLVLPPGTLVCKGADLNFDSKVNITDFSILLYFWKQTKPANACADINFDGIVNIVDFSIMMYWWTK